jgi:hypothetical protein
MSFSAAEMSVAMGRKGCMAAALLRNILLSQSLGCALL